jgi:hypothetical protein
MRAWFLALAVVAVACNEAAMEGADDDDATSGDSASAGSETEDSSEATDGGDTDDDRPSPYTGGGTTDGAMPTMGPDEVVASAVAGLRAFVLMQPDTVVDAFEAMAVFEDGCPEVATIVDMPDVKLLQWYTEGCTTSAGLEIRGGGRFEHYSNVVMGDATTETAVLSGEGGTFRLENGGRWIEFSGYVEYVRGSTADANEGYFAMFAEAAADPQTATGSPILEGTVRGTGSIYAAEAPGYKAIGGSGSLTGDAIGNALAMSFDEVLVLNVGCPSEPAGTVAVRDDQGFWHDVVFDVGTVVGEEYEWDPALCDGCGTYLAGGTQSGDACVTQGDIDSLLDWQGLPW